MGRCGNLILGLGKVIVCPSNQTTMRERERESGHKMKFAQNTHSEAILGGTVEIMAFSVI